MPTQPAILGTARVGNVRLGYAPAALTAIRRTKLSILVGGVAARIRTAGLTLHDILNAAPNTCAIVVDNANPPTVEQDVRISIGVDAPRLLFGGTVQTVDLTYAGRSTNRVCPCTAIDYTARLNRRRPFGTWVTTSATTIAQSLVATYAPAFGITHIDAALPLVSIIFDGSTDFIGCLSQLATAIGGYCKVEDLDVYLFLADTSDAPDPIDVTHPPLNDAPITCSQDVSQLRTRVFGKGHGEVTLSDVLAGETIIPIADAVMFGTIGGAGRALAGTTPDGAQSQQIAYTGVRQAGAGSLVGPGAAPSVAPALALAAGSGLGSGVYQYAYTDVTAAGESLPSPLATVTVGLTTPPSLAPTPGTPTAGAGPDAGAHDYEATFVTATGETTPSPISSQATTTGSFLAAPSVAPTASSNSFAHAQTAGHYRTAYTFVSASGETTISPIVDFDMGGSDYMLWSVPTGPTGTIARSLYRTAVGGAVLKLAQTVNDNTTLIFGNFVTDAGLGAIAPAVNTTAISVVPLTGIPLGAAAVTSRKLYRRFNGTGTFKLVTTIADNTTTTYSDTTLNVSLGAAAPSTNTATGVNQVALSAIALGPTAVTARKIYRTAVGGAQLKLQQTIANNSATVGVQDATADGSLGANVPTGDTSGISFAGGQVNAGSTSLLTASPAPFFSAGGWAILSSGQAVRYTGITGNTLTGIPASGPGAILTTVLYGSQVLPAPSLIGVTGLVLAMAKGTPVHLWVQRDDLSAQATQAALDTANGVTPADGIYDGPIISDERRGEASLIALCDANLQLYARPIVTFTYATRDLKTRSGKTVHINLSGYPVGDYVIQECTITQLDAHPGTGPRFSVTASTVRFSLDDLLRQLLTAQAA